MKLGIVITCKNLWDYTSQAIQSLFTTHPYTLIVIDDGSMDVTKVELRKLASEDPRVVVITDPRVDSLSAKWNIGVKTAFDNNCEAVLICNNDILFNPITIDTLVARLSRGDVALVSAHNLRNELAEPTAILTFPVNYEASESPHPDFSCFLISKEAYEKVGPFDENFSPCYFEDGDYHLRIGKMGLKAITTTGAPYYHYGSRTQNSVFGGLCRPSRFDELREYLRSKHGVVPGDPTYELVCQGESL